MTPDTESRILMEVGEMKRQLAELISVIHSTGDRAGLAEGLRIMRADCLAMHTEIADLWTVTEDLRRDLRKLEERPGAVVASVADRVIVAVLILISGGVVGLIWSAMQHPVARSLHQ